MTAPRDYIAEVQALTDADLDAIEARANAATAGPWKRDNYGGYVWTDWGKPSAKGEGMIADANVDVDDAERKELGIVDDAALARIRGWGRLTGRAWALALTNEQAIAQQQADLDLMAAARTDVPRLIAALRTARAANKGEYARGVQDAAKVIDATVARESLDVLTEHAVKCCAEDIRALLEATP